MNADGLHEAVAKLVKAGAAVEKAVFNDAVNNADGTPESYFSDESQNKSRRAQMVWTPHGLFCQQKNAHGTLKTFTVPLPMIKFAYFK